jgi:UPF0755 protein
VYGAHIKCKREVVSVRALKFLLVVVLLVAGVVGFYVLLPYGPVGQTFVEIAPGIGTEGIAARLQDAGVIRSRYAFEALRIAKELSGSGGSLKAGEYRFQGGTPLLTVYDRIRRGDVFTITVVVPEGYNIFDIADAVQAAGLATRADFLKAEMTDTELIAQWSPQAKSLEGYLFPDTYRFSRRATPEQMLAMMVKRFGQQVHQLGLSGTDIPTVITTASLVEKEVRFDDERTEVASVFQNRLAAGMPLQTDPAVIYASQLRGTWTGVIHQSELHSDSPYNTYMHKGLPPGPICNPGLAALKATLHPAKTDYLYFVAGANGRTRFASSLEEHNGNVAAYRGASR